MKLTDLIEAAGREQVTPRFVRFLIAEGVLDPPLGGRARAEYGAAHLRGIVNYLRLRELGFSLTQVKQIVRAERGETVPVTLAPGLSLHVDLARLDPGLSAREAAGRAYRVLSDILATLRAAPGDDTHPDDTHPDDTGPGDTSPDDAPRNAAGSHGVPAPGGASPDNASPEDAPPDKEGKTDAGSV